MKIKITFATAFEKKIEKALKLKYLSQCSSAGRAADL